MRCPECRKFVSYDTNVDPEEIDAPEVVETTFKASYRRALACIECGEELKEGTVEIDHDFDMSIEVDEGDAEGDNARDYTHEWEIDDCHAATTESAKGYGVNCSVVVTCRMCHAVVEFDAESSVAACDMEELV